MISQLQTLSKIIKTKDFSIVTQNNLTDDFFFNYKNEFNYVKKHIETTGTVPDAMTFLGVFPNFDLQDVAEPDSYLLEQLYKDYNGAYMAESFNKVKPLIENGKIDEAVQLYLGGVDGLRRGGSSACVDITKNTERFGHYLDMQANLSKYFISTGLPELDKAIYGIDVKNENMVIAARTGIGKSWTLLIMAAAAAKAGKTVGIYSGEMSVDKVSYRLDTLLSGISNKAITHGNLEVKDTYKRYIDDLPNLGLGPIKVITPAMISGPATVDALRAWVEKEHIEILFIDQYSLLDDTSKTTVMHEKVANISKAIKRLQVEKQIPIISVAQMNRTKNEDKDGNKVQDSSQIGLSDRIGQDATCIIMLDRNIVKDKVNPNNKPQDQLILNIVKNRDGGSGKLTYAANFDSGTFKFIPEDLDDKSADDIRNSYEGDAVL